MNLAGLLSEQTLIGLLQLLLGSAVKPQLKDKLHASGVKLTAWIPLLNVILAYIGFTIMPASAVAATAIGHVSGEAASVLVAAILQTVVVTGAHSTFKNTLFPALRALAFWGAKKLAKTTD